MPKLTPKLGKILKHFNIVRFRIIVYTKKVLPTTIHIAPNLRGVMKAIKLFIIVALFISCSSETERKEQALRKKIMDVHDELMPQMNNVKELQVVLQERKGELIANSSMVTSGNNLSEPKIDSLIKALEIADESMMVWMENYTLFNQDTISHEHQMAYLREEKEKIEAVKLKVLSSIVEARAVLADKQ